MFVDDKSNNCLLYDKYFLDDLYPYSYDASGDTINYKLNESKTEAFNVYMDRTLDFIEKFTKNNNDPKDVWIPLFITPNDSPLDTKMLFKGSSSIPKTIGIERAIFFEPQFQNWEVLNGDMSTDWIITPQIAPFIPQYGIMFWYKKSSQEFGKKLEAKNVPYHTVVSPASEYNDGDVLITSSSKLIKKTEDLYLIINKDHISYTSEDIKQERDNYFSIKKYLKFNNLETNNIQFIIYKQGLLRSNRDISLFIPEGEMYSYIDSEEIASENYKLGIISKSYLSPVLYPIYREIYHILTLNHKKYINKVKIQAVQTAADIEGGIDTGGITRQPVPMFNLAQSRIIKKIAYILATMPGMDRTTISILNHIINDNTDIYKEFKKLLNETKIISLNQEIKIIQDIINKISLLFTNMVGVDYNHSNPSINTGFINSRKDLFERLLFKYGSKLRLYNKSNIIYKNKLKYGPHIKINQDVMSKCAIDLTNTVVYNNVKFKVGDFIAESDISLDNSLFILTNNNLKNEKVTIPLWDIEKKNLLNSRIPLTAGRDLEIKFSDPDIKTVTREGFDEQGNSLGTVFKEIQFDLDDASVDLGDPLNPTLLGDEVPEIEWTRISGPDCLRFSNRFLAQTAISSSSRFPNSYDINPTLYIKKPGRYVLQLMVKVSFGIVYDTVVIHVTEPGAYERSEPLLQKTTKFLTSSDNLCIMLPSIRECAFGKQGIFWPSYSDCSVKEPVAREIEENVNNQPQPGGSKVPRIISFGQNHHKFAIPMVKNDKQEKIIQETDATLSIEYDCNNTIIEISKMMLTYMMDNNNDCSQCQSLYQGIPDNLGFMIDAGYEFSFYDIPSNQIMNVSAPDSLSTKRADIKAYGGFDKKTVDTLRIDLPYHPQPGVKLDSFDLTADLLNQSTIDNENSATTGKSVSHICHDTYVPYDTSVRFDKGYFHPFSGWLDTIGHSEFRNKTSVVNFKQNKSPQVFRGLGIYNLSNSFIDSKATVYRSKITLDVDNEFYKRRVPPLPKGISVDIPDQIIHYGYRAGSDQTSLKTLPFVDNYDASFTLEKDEAVSDEEYCDNALSEYNYDCSYTMTQPAGAGGNIYNLEIKLNYLNYINPKDLVIWLEVDSCDKVRSFLSPPSVAGGDDGPTKIQQRPLWYYISDQAYSNVYNKFNKISNTKIKDYIFRLWDMNDNDFSDETMPNYNNPFDTNLLSKKRSSKHYLYLLNQDHIHGCEFNSTIIFTDTIDKNRNPNNNNISSTLRPYNNHVSIEENGIIYLPPTLSANGFSDNEIYQYKNIILNNDLYNHNHRFSKFNKMPLYDPTPSEDSVDNSSQTSFTLCVAVLNESDSIEPYDRLRITDAATGFIGSKVKNKSNLVKNSLCSWDLILHRNDGLGTHGRDSLGNIDYYEDTPTVSGYNYIADFSDKLHLIPPVNLNAPNLYTTDGRACHYSKESLNIPSFYPPQAFDLSPFILLMPASLVGALVSLSVADMQLNNQAREFANYLGSLRRAAQEELFNQAWFVPKYDRYPYGSPNKALISISRDNNIWYKLEASIFRYENSLVFQKNKYKFYRLHYKSLMKQLAIFKPIKLSKDTLISSLYSAYIKKISIDLNGNLEQVPTKNDMILSVQELKIQLKEIEMMIEQENQDSAKNILIEERDSITKKIDAALATIASIGFDIKDGDLISLTNQTVKDTEGYYIYENKKINKINSFKDLFSSNKLSEYNNLIELAILDISLGDLASQDKLIMCDGIRPYYFFKDTDHKSIITFKTKLESDLTDEEKREVETVKKELSDLKNNKDSTIISILDKENELWDLTHIKYENKIIGLGYTYNAGKYQTIIALENSIIGTDISVEPYVSKRILLYKDDFTSFTNDSELPFNIWSEIDESKIHIKSPIHNGSSWGAGNYGYGSNLVRNIPISEQQIESRLVSISNIYDIEKNSTNNIGKFKIIGSNGQVTNDSPISLGYRYSMDNLIKEQTIYDNIIYAISGSGDISTNVKTQISSLFKELKVNVFGPNHDSGSFVEINISDTSNEYGEIYFNKDIKQKIIYSLKLPYTIENLKERVNVITNTIKENESTIDQLSAGLTDELLLILRENILNEIDRLKTEISTLMFEKNNILDYINKISGNITSIPHIVVEVKENDDGSLSFIENHKNNYYWIDIDPRQSCSIDTDRLPKILKTVRMVCIPFNDRFTDLADPICVMPVSYGGAESIADGIDESFQQRTGDTEYTLSDKNIKAMKAKYPTLEWPADDAIGEVVEREFFLNFAGIEKAQLVKATYSYILPIVKNEVERPFDTIVNDRVYNIYNLDDAYQLWVDFKRIPRTIKGKDTIYDVYEPNDLGQLSKSIIPAKGGPIDGSFRAWKCIDPNTGQYVEPPVYFKWLNEMLFRAYFGSVDGIEHKGAINAESKDETYWIPYDYN